MNRRQFISTIVLIVAALFGPAVQGAERIGVLMLHGKSPGSAEDPNVSGLKYRLQREGMLVRMPDMPWSRTRYLDGDWDKAMEEMTTQVAALRKEGATKIVLIGHSMGAPAVLGFAARKGDVQALVMLAPGHIPSVYYATPSTRAVHDSIDEARKLAKIGRGAERAAFVDINQGARQTIYTTADNYLSYFDPLSEAEMAVTAPKIPSTPTLVVIGDGDPSFKIMRSYLFDKLPANPKSQYLEVSANHLSTPGVAADAVVAWIRKAVAN